MLAKPDGRALALPLPRISAFTSWLLMLVGGSGLAHLTCFARWPVVLTAWCLMPARLGSRRGRRIPLRRTFGLTPAPGRM
jgi:hypothetical protein